MPQNIKISINPPSKTAPGYAKRLRRAAAFQESIASGQMSARIMDDLIIFLSDYCQAGEGTTPEQVQEALWELSEEQFVDVLSAVTGGGAQVPPES